MTWTLTGVVEDATGTPCANLTIPVGLGGYPKKDAAGNVIRAEAEVHTDSEGDLVGKQIGATEDGPAYGPCVFPSVPGAIWRLTIATGRTVAIPDPGVGATVTLADYIAAGTPIPPDEAVLVRAQVAALNARLDALELGGGAVTSVNTKTGAVTLTAADVGAATVAQIPTNNNQLTNGAGYLSAVPNLPASKITSGVIAPARLGTGTTDSTTVLYGDGTFKTAPTGGGGGGAVAYAVVRGGSGSDTTLSTGVGVLPLTTTVVATGLTPNGTNGITITTAGYYRCNARVQLSPTQTSWGGAGSAYRVTIDISTNPTWDNVGITGAWTTQSGLIAGSGAVIEHQTVGYFAAGAVVKLGIGSPEVPVTYRQVYLDLQLVAAA